MRYATILTSVTLLFAGAATMPAAHAQSPSVPMSRAVQAPLVATLAAVQDPTAQPQPQTPVQPQANPPAKVDVTVEHTTRVWYADPMWIAIGVVAVVVIVLLVAFVSRGGGTSTTVVR